ncbi:uncharacterized protein BJX67DRAFT_385498 [Aspergillus lucknowensis]|uniref:F-box domain protein n=1 Tax=Aspergillus lucknowensis TaxID=176173 RepID=A0ABR4LDI0_9EURO
MDVTQERQRTLRSLSETCRFFHDIYTPLLFSSLRFTSFEEIVAPDFADFAVVSANLRHVRSFKVIAGPYNVERLEAEQEASLYDEFNSNIICWLMSMPNLVSFTIGIPGPWLTYDEGINWVNGVPLYSKLISTLQVSCPKLRRLTLCVPSIPEVDEDEEELEWRTFRKDVDVQCLAHFCNLTSLVLIGEFALPASFNSVVSTLLSSPSLRDLNLDLTGVHMYTICTEYAQSGGQPFRLKRLRFPVDDNRSTNGWLCLEQLTNIANLESLELDIRHTRSGSNTYNPASPEPTSIYQRIADPAAFLSLRRLSVNYLEEPLFALLRKIGQSPSFPPFFLSELFLETFHWNSAIKDGFNIHPQKRLYWPRCFVLGQNVGYRSTPEFRQGLVREVSEWQGLRLLHLNLDMETDRSHLVTLTDTLRPNLRELYITDEHQPSGDSSIDDDPEYGSDLAFAKRLCANSRISYLVVYDTGYRVIRQGGQDIQVEIVGNDSSEMEEAEIFTMFRERSEI